MTRLRDGGRRAHNDREQIAARLFAADHRIAGNGSMTVQYRNIGETRTRRVDAERMGMD